MPILTYVAGVASAQKEAMMEDESVILIGEDVRANLDGTAPDFASLFGPDRVRNMPISEAGFVGLAVGAAMTGLRPIVDMAFSTFMYLAMDQLVNQAAKNRYMFGGQASVPIVFRAALVYGSSAGAHHSDRPYPMFMNVPGLKVIAPATPTDVKGMLRTAIRCDDPVICFEDANLRTLEEAVPEGEYLIPLGTGRVVREGSDVTVVAIAGAVRLAAAAAQALASEGISVELIDPRTLVPLDTETILKSVAKTGRLVVVDPAHRTCSAASEISATVAEHAFHFLRTGIRRVTTPDIQIPFSPALERSLYPNEEKIIVAVREAAEGVGA